jgi:hypothetical protein
MVAFISAQRDGGVWIIVSLNGIVDNGFGHFALGMPIGNRHHSACDQSMAVVTEGVAPVAQFAG